MIITRLIGGLGNQLFQYAVARHLAEIHRTTLKFDISFLDTDHDSSFFYHKFALWPFDIGAKFASGKETKKYLINRSIFKKWPASSYLHTLLRKLQGTRFTHTIIEQHFHFDPRVLEVPDGVYLLGNWQTEKYFIDIENIIRKELTFRIPQMGKDKEISENIASCNSVSIHIRRGYSVTDVTGHHGVIPLDYYNECMDRVARMVDNPQFFLFTDDPEWVVNNFRGHYPITFVLQNGIEKNYEDMRLMSQCKHHIIANSSFSWWGAWLNPRKDKIVFAPKSWFTKEDRNTKDLIPRSWFVV